MNQQTSEDPNARSQEFVPVEGGGNATSAEAMLVAAYLVMWALLLGFIGLSWRRQLSLETRLRDIERSVGGGDGKPAS